MSFSAFIAVWCLLSTRGTLGKVKHADKQGYYNGSNGADAIQEDQLSSYNNYVAPSDLLQYPAPVDGQIQPLINQLIQPPIQQPMGPYLQPYGQLPYQPPFNVKYQPQLQPLYQPPNPIQYYFPPQMLPPVFTSPIDAPHGMCRGCNASYPRDPLGIMKPDGFDKKPPNKSEVSEIHQYPDTAQSGSLGKTGLGQKITRPHGQEKYGSESFDTFESESSESEDGPPELDTVPSEELFAPAAPIPKSSYVANENHERESEETIQESFYNDPIDLWVPKEPRIRYFRDLLTRVMVEKRHFKGELREIHSVQTNRMRDMLLFKMKFTYVKPKEHDPTNCMTVFSKMKGKLFLGRMECQRKAQRIKYGVWREEDPEDQRFMLPVTMAMKMSRNHANPHHITQIFTRRSAKKMKFKVAFVIQKNRRMTDFQCYTVFTMYAEGHLRPLKVHSFTCDDYEVTGRKRRIKRNKLRKYMKTNGRRMRKRGRGMRNHSQKPNLKTLGLAKIYALNAPRRDKFWVPTRKGTL